MCPRLAVSTESSSPSACSSRRSPDTPPSPVPRRPGPSASASSVVLPSDIPTRGYGFSVTRYTPRRLHQITVSAVAVLRDTLSLSLSELRAGRGPVGHGLGHCRQHLLTLSPFRAPMLPRKTFRPAQFLR
eukprot:5676116-Prymnesium_polylepis.1